MNISTKGRYALRALTHLAVSYAEKKNAPVSIKEISRREDISNRYLENIFVTLRKAGIVKSLKGEKGGFILAAAPEKLTVFDVLDAVEKETSATRCAVDMTACGRSAKCGVRKVWAKLDSLVSGFLKETTLLEVTDMHVPPQNRAH